MLVLTKKNQLTLSRKEIKLKLKYIFIYLLFLLKIDKYLKQFKVQQGWS